jgi:hypothetical protein
MSHTGRQLAAAVTPHWPARARAAVALSATMIALVVLWSASSSEAQAAAAFDVGVVPATRSCPAGSEAVTIRMDDEDESNRNERGGFIGAIRSDANTEFFFCRVDGLRFRAFQPNGPGTEPQPYAVLKLGTSCPNGSIDFARRFDNEDDSNNNFSIGDIFPNVSNANTVLNFCLFFSASNGTMGVFPNVGVSYGVFTRSLAERGFVRTDDEDDSNNNQYFVNSTFASIAMSIVSSGDNTRLELGRAR